MVWPVELHFGLGILNRGHLTEQSANVADMDTVRNISVRDVEGAKPACARVVCQYGRLDSSIGQCRDASRALKNQAWASQLDEVRQVCSEKPSVSTWPFARWRSSDFGHSKFRGSAIQTGSELWKYPHDWLVNVFRCAERSRRRRAFQRNSFSANSRRKDLKRKLESVRTCPR